MKEGMLSCQPPPPETVMSLACFEQTPAILGLTPFVRSPTLSAQAISINHANRRTQRRQLKRQKNGKCIQELKQSSGKPHSVQWKLPPKHPQRKKTGCERRRERGRERKKGGNATRYRNEVPKSTPRAIQ